MKNLPITFLLIVIVSIFHACSSSHSNKKKAGISIRQTNDERPSNLPSNEPSANFKTRPSSVLLTGNDDHRLVTVYKVNYDKKHKKTFIGSNRFHRTYPDSYYGNQERHHHFMPGIEAIYGYNMMNVAHYNFKTKQRKNLFEAPVLINTLYYPSLLQDSLNNEPVQRDYYMVSVYDEDTNQDSLINRNDLRRFYHFDIEGNDKKALIPTNYSVLSSEYDAVNDLMFVFARLDENKNGRREDNEPVHVFYFDLKSPKIGERLY